MTLEIVAFPGGPVATNAYLVADTDTRDALVIDARSLIPAPDLRLDLLREMRGMLHRYFDHVPHVIVEPGAKTGVPVLVDNPKEVGADRIANTLAAANVAGLSAQVAYSFIFSLPSILLLVMLLAVQIDIRTGSAITTTIQDTIRAQAPQEVQDVLLGVFDSAMGRARQTGPTVGAMVSSLVALYVAGGGFSALGGACARAGGVKDERSFLVRRFEGTVSVFVLALVLVFGFVAFLFGQNFWHWLAERWAVAAGVDAFWIRLREPLTLLLVFVSLIFLYRVGAGVKHSLRYLAPGALLATVLWYVLLRGFQLYLEVIDPGSAFGAAGGLMVLMFFFYLSSMVFIGGAMVSAVIGRRYDAPPDAETPAEAAGSGGGDTGEG